MVVCRLAGGDCFLHDFCHRLGQPRVREVLKPSRRVRPSQVAVRREPERSHDRLHVVRRHGETRVRFSDKTCGLVALCDRNDRAARREVLEDLLVASDGFREVSSSKASAERWRPRAVGRSTVPACSTRSATPLREIRSRCSVVSVPASTIRKRCPGFVARRIPAALSRGSSGRPTTLPVCTRVVVQSADGLACGAPLGFKSKVPAVRHTRRGNTETRFKIGHNRRRRSHDHVGSSSDARFQQCVETALRRSREGLTPVLPTVTEVGDPGRTRPTMRRPRRWAEDGGELVARRSTSPRATMRRALTTTAGSQLTACRSRDHDLGEKWTRGTLQHLRASCDRQLATPEQPTQH